MKVSKQTIKDEWWRDYVTIRQLAQVAPIGMTQHSFLSRCKVLNEIYQKISVSFLRKLLKEIGFPPETIKDLKSLKLLQSLLNIIEQLSINEKGRGYLCGTYGPADTVKNKTMAALFAINDLRIADAHVVADKMDLSSLCELGFDVASIGSDYSRALDFVMDEAIRSFKQINEAIVHFLEI